MNCFNNKNSKINNTPKFILNIENNPNISKILTISTQNIEDEKSTNITEENTPIYILNITISTVNAPNC